MSSQSFEFDNNIVSTIQPNTSVKDLLRVPFHKYSHSLFDSFTDTPEFLDICNELESDDELVSLYNEYGRDAYDFNEWCEENLVEGFSKYLDYRYSQYEYDFSNFVYDLDFYNYLRKINFNPDKVNLKENNKPMKKNKDQGTPGAKTGDNNTIAVYLLVGLLSLSMIFIILYFQKRKKDNI